MTRVLFTVLLALPDAAPTGSITDLGPNFARALFYGFQQIASPFQGRFLCVAPSSTRTAVQLSRGQVGFPNCTGSYSFDFNALIRSGTDTRLVTSAACAARRALPRLRARVTSQRLRGSGRFRERRSG
jgi:hypothetical protein